MAQAYCSAAPRGTLGDEVDNTLEGASGNDTLYGLNGNDLSGTRLASTGKDVAALLA